ncbi:hypothetical protein FIA58_005440 [Flavobacterium jejuense]|uniref:Cytochrome c domain-containing protein n=1 Tax=Flavobacterium jejuense TaxID=1544455 RepID=A0ABX0IN32_9FLAO|nr:hypothetical protein [Flavobacterium jejuense]NHN25118.1 hypothetical protein [Flavobacterium jejuense]
MIKFYFLKARNYGLVTLALLFILFSCKEEKKENVKEKEVVTEVKSDEIIPQDFPSDLGIKGFNFPEDSLKIYNWLEKQDKISITNHSWGIWAGLTSKSNQIYEGDTLLVYETWMGVDELAKIAANGGEKNGYANVKKNRTQLKVPKQFIHAQLFANKNAIIDTTFSLFETVSYNPQAANFATSNLIFNQSVLDSYKVENGIGKIPDFPQEAITTKPVYFSGIPDNNGLIRVPVWPGMPNPVEAFGDEDWKTYVYVDIKNRQNDKTLVPVTTENPTKEEIEAATCNVDEFINYKLDKEAAAFLNEHQDKGASRGFKAGDLVLLVAMHVGTKEISNWTWQTFFWSYDSQKPFFPSSESEASLIPSVITGAAANYSVSSAYAMVWPNQPITGGSDKGATPIIAFNPYLEAGFGADVFSVKNTFKPEFKYGVQTNCMTCHALATASGSNGYSTDQYIDMKDDVFFKNQVQLDFAWSIQGNINKNK